jgi:pimeloyl-ACP methyl ester carboxylesterase
MSDQPSSAKPQALYLYAERMRAVDERLLTQATLLADTLDHFARTCTHHPTGISGADAKPMLLLGKLLLDQHSWVRGVGQGFEQADGLDLESSMADLHREIDELYGTDPEAPEKPIKIVQIGPGEYLVLIAGTDNDGIPGSNDWPSNLRTGQGIPSAYMLQVRMAMEKSIPPGAKVHLAGHSQGGNVAMMLADTQSLVDEYSIQSITTFGSPPNVPINPRLGQVRYHNFAIKTDPVPYSTSPTALNTIGGLLLPHDPLMSMSLFSADIAPRFENTVIPETPGFLEAHNSYKDSPFLQQQTLPFHVREWQVVGEFDSGPLDTLRQATDDLIARDRTVPQRVIGFGDTWIDVHKMSAMITFKNIVTRATYDAPVPLRTAVDRGLDWMSLRVATGPRPSEAVETTIRGVIDASSTSIEGQLQILAGTATGTGEIIKGQILGDLRTLEGLAEGLKQSSEEVSEGVSDLRDGRYLEGGTTIAQGLTEGASTAAQGYAEGLSIKIDSTIEGAQTIASNVAEGTSKVAEGTLDGAKSIGQGIVDFVF